MEHLKMLGLAAVSAVALLAFAGTASANPLTSPPGTSYTGTIKAVSEGPVWLAGSFNTVECRKSTLEGKVEAHGLSSASGKVSSLTFSECSYPVTVESLGTLEINSIEGGNGKVLSSGAKISISTSIGTCVYTTSNTPIGTLTGSGITGGNATLDSNSAAIPRTAGNFNCGSSGTMDGSYEVTTPSTLDAGHSPASANPLTSPEGTPYTSTIKAESEGAISFDGKFGTVSCKSAFEGKVESHSGNTAGGKLASLNFSECSEPVTVKAAGSLEIRNLGNGEAAVTSSGAEISISTSGGPCVFTASGTVFGLLTDSGVTGKNATIETDFSAIPKTEGGSACGPNAVLTGSYKVTTPSTLHTGHSSNPLTSPEGTPYTSTIKAESEGATSLDGAFTDVTCQKSTAEGKVEFHSSTAARGNLSSLAFSECNFPVTVTNPGALEIHVTSAKGTVRSSGAVVKIITSVGECFFSTFTTDIGTLTDSSVTAGNATLDINSSKIPRTGGNFLCGSSGTWTGSYKVTTPTALYLGHSSSPLTSPKGTSYTSTIKAESEGATSLDGIFTTVTCNKSTAEGKIETHSPTSAEGKLSSLTFAECNFPVSVLKPGSLKIHAAEGATGTTTSSGAEISINTSVGTCVFTTNATDVGTITDTDTTGSNATLDINEAKIPRTAGNFLCGASGTWTGSYKITTPSTLYVHP
jgi:hypothetical protein